MNGKHYNRPYPPVGNPLHRHIDEKYKAEEELVHAIGDSRDILFRAETVFPLTLFPDTVTVDRTKVSISHREFFKVGEAISIRIEDILNLTASVGPFFGSIRISTRFFDPEKPYIVDHLWRGDALRIKRIVQGLLIARQQEVDTSALSARELARDLDELGKVSPEEKV